MCLQSATIVARRRRRNSKGHNLALQRIEARDARPDR